jgi:diguanylate cyclase (GGDEF)-like protein/PAS domain S-box-containing protein
MEQNRSRLRDGEDESPEAKLARLIAANEALQARIEEHLRAEQDWAAERALFRAMIDQVPDYLFVKDVDSRFVVANRAVAADLGRTPEELIGKTDFDLHSPDFARKFFADEQRVVHTGKPAIALEESIMTTEGHRKWLSTTKVPLRDNGGKIVGIVGICRDVTERKLAEDQIHFLAHHDALTGLPNRVLLMDRIEQALLQAERNGTCVTVVFMDLDNFKLVNDSLGHSAGDMLLRTVAERMVKSLRTSDTVVRIGGDEFVILLPDQHSPSDAAGILEKMRAAIAQPIAIEGQLFRVTVSMGLATYPADGNDGETLLMNADTAMYQAKERGRDNFQHYTAEMNISARERRILQEGLRLAVERKEFALVYQPQFDLRTGEIVAVEALLRWHHPTLGVIPPAKFIPIAESTGLIVPLGDWVLHEACRQNKAWQDAGIPPVTVGVNVSARQFRDGTLVKRVASTLKSTGLEPGYLELELTESLLMQDAEQAIGTMRELQALGVKFAIDDFGTGYSSLSALKAFPLARLKIDRSFVHNVVTDPNDRSIAMAMISLGQKLNLRVIAEGVETAEQVRFLSENHCDEIQGFHFSHPVEAWEMAEMLRKPPKPAVAS